MSVEASAGWHVFTEDGGDHVHVTPLNDLIEHEHNDDGDCACGPTVRPDPREDGSIGWSIIHDSLDGREQKERANG